MANEEVDAIDKWLKYVDGEQQYIKVLLNNLKVQHIMNYCNRFFMQYNNDVVSVTYNNLNEVEDFTISTTHMFKSSYCEKVQIPNCSAKEIPGLGKYWLESPYKRRIKGIGFYPRGDVPEGHFDTFLPYKMKSLNYKIRGPEALINEEQHALVLGGLKSIYDHFHSIVCNGCPKSCEFVQDALATRFQELYLCKFGIVLAFYSQYQQCGKGFVFDAAPKGFMAKLMDNKYHHHSERLSSGSGLLGNFNWSHRNKLLTYLDENGEFAHKIEANSAFLSYLSNPKWSWVEKNCTPIEMADYNMIVMCSNDKKLIRQVKGGARNFAIESSSKYSKHYADENIDGMTPQIRAEYFGTLANAMNNPLVQQAFVFDMETRDLSKYKPDTPGIMSSKWQMNIPNTKLLKEMETFTKCPIEDFVDEWRNDRVLIEDRSGQFVKRGPLPSKNLWYHPSSDSIHLYNTIRIETICEQYENTSEFYLNTPSLYNVFKNWARMNNRTIETNWSRASDFKSKMNELCHLEDLFTMKQKSKKKTQHYELIGFDNDDQETQPQKRQRTANAAENRGRAQAAPVQNPMGAFFER